MLSPMLKVLISFLKLHGLAFAFSIYFVFQLFFHRYTPQSWQYLISIVFILSLALAFRKEVWLPAKEWLMLLTVAVLLTVFQSVMNGGHLVEERWINRYALLLTAFVFFQFFKDEENILKLRTPVVLFVSAFVLYSLGQYFFIYQPDPIASLSSFSSRFWNISFYSQAALVSLPFLSYYQKSYKTHDGDALENEVVRLWKRRWIDVITLALLFTLFASQSRTSILGFVFYAVVQLFRPLGLSRKKFVLMTATAVLAAVLFSKIPAAPAAAQTASPKALSLNFRQNVYKKAIQMAQDFPTGVGTNNSTYHLFLYYDQNRITEKFDELYKTVHSEPLQVLTEEGWGIFFIYCGFMIGITFLAARNLWRRQVSTTLFDRLLIALIPEILFHFPSDMYWPVTLFALALAPALGPQAWSARIGKPFKIILPVLCFLVLATYFVRENYVIPKKYGVTYCQIFHDNSDQCKRYFAEIYFENDFESANKISQALIKYEPFSFYALALDYTLGTEPRSQIAACLYYNLFNGEISIPDSQTEKCALIKDRQKKIEVFTEYSERR